MVEGIDGVGLVVTPGILQAGRQLLGPPTEKDKRHENKRKTSPFAMLPATVEQPVLYEPRQAKHFHIEFIVLPLLAVALARGTQEPYNSY